MISYSCKIQPHIDAVEISCVIITGANKKLVGIFTERNAARLLLKRSHSLKQPIETIMSAPVQTVSQTCPYQIFVRIDIT